MLFKYGSSIFHILTNIMLNDNISFYQRHTRRPTRQQSLTCLQKWCAMTQFIMLCIISII